MRLKWLFLTLVALLVALTALLLFLSAHEGSVYFYIAEIAVVISILFLYFFYRSIVRPIISLSNGVELLRSQDLNQRLTSVGQAEADAIAATFNMLLAKLHDERLRNIEQEHFLKLIIDNSPTAIVLLDGNGRVSMCNRSALLSLGDCTGGGIADINHPIGRLMSETQCGMNVTRRVTDGKVYRVIHESFMDNGYAHHFYLIDELTREVAKAERTAYEKVIRMMAHEVNNTLAGIKATMSVIADIATDDSSLADLTEPVGACLGRIEALSAFVNRFAAVIKLPDPVMTEINLSQIAESAVSFCRQSALGRNITVEISSSANVSIIADRQLIEQVLVNILKNAVESVGADGMIRVSVNETCLTVTDNGPGIAPENVDSPFFSTKPNGHGIGLMMIAEILKKHRFTFSLMTGNDGLTRFTINFKYGGSQ